VKQTTEPSVDASAKKLRRKSRKIRSLYVLLTLLLVAFIGAGAGGYKLFDNSRKESARLRAENAQLANPEESAKLETERVKASVAQLIDVPEDEDPTIASVVDASKLSNQAFFKNAQNGDKVLMYSKAKKAILYRPSSNKIIEVAPINIGNNEKPANPDPDPDADPDSDAESDNKAP